MHMTCDHVQEYDAAAAEGEEGGEEEGEGDAPAPPPALAQSIMSRVTAMLGQPSHGGSSRNEEQEHDDDEVPRTSRWWGGLPGGSGLFGSRPQQAQVPVPEELLQSFQGIFPDADAETAQYFLRKQNLVLDRAIDAFLQAGEKIPEWDRPPPSAAAADAPEAHPLCCVAGTQTNMKSLRARPMRRCVSRDTPALVPCRRSLLNKSMTFQQVNRASHML